MAEPDLAMLRHLLAQARAANAGTAPQSGSLASGGSGPHDPGVETRVAKLESDVGHIRSDISDIKGVLVRLAPKIDEMYGKISYFATKEDVATLKSEIDKRPTRRQSITDIIVFVGFIGTLLMITARVVH